MVAATAATTANEVTVKSFGRPGASRSSREEEGEEGDDHARPGADVDGEVHRVGDRADDDHADADGGEFPGEDRDAARVADAAVARPQGDVVPDVVGERGEQEAGDLRRDVELVPVDSRVVAQTGEVELPPRGLRGLDHTRQCAEEQIGDDEAHDDDTRHLVGDDHREIGARRRGRPGECGAAERIDREPAETELEDLEDGVDDDARHHCHR
ncbi:hypothetical protein IOD13_02720 [Brevibacterium casei]|nr:hypothetical protein [Brevibacterium casei]